MYLSLPLSLSIYIYIYSKRIVFQCLFTLPATCVMLRQSVKQSTPKFCTPSRDNICLFPSLIGVLRLHRYM